MDKNKVFLPPRKRVRGELLSCPCLRWTVRTTGDRNHSDPHFHNRFSHLLPDVSIKLIVGSRPIFPTWSSFHAASVIFYENISFLSNYHLRHRQKYYHYCCKKLFPNTYLWPRGKWPVIYITFFI